MNIHPTAIIHKDAELDSSVTVGPYCTIGEHVKIGKNTHLRSHIVIDGWTTIGADNTIYPFTSIGLEPQDLKYKGEKSRVIIGDHNTIREYVTLHRGTKSGGGITQIGKDNVLMAYTHVAHDCILGDRVIMSNAATLAGSITVGDDAIIGGLSGIHQFVRIGSYAMVGGCSAVAQDVPPYVRVAGNHAKLYGLNSIGLKRHGFSSEQITTLKFVYKLIFRSGLTLKDAVRQSREKWPNLPEVERFLSFVEKSERGICR